MIDWPNSWICAEVSRFSSQNKQEDGPNVDLCKLLWFIFLSYRNNVLWLDMCLHPGDVYEKFPPTRSRGNRSWIWMNHKLRFRLFSGQIFKHFSPAGVWSYKHNAALHSWRKINLSLLLYHLNKACKHEKWRFLSFILTDSSLHVGFWHISH